MHKMRVRFARSDRYPFTLVAPRSYLTPREMRISSMRPSNIPPPRLIGTRKGEDFSLSRDKTSLPSTNNNSLSAECTPATRVRRSGP